MKFQFDVNGPFEIMKTKTNTGASHPLAPLAAQSKAIGRKPITAFVL